MFANMASHSVEVTEAEQPIQLLAYEFVADKAGAGKYRGGVPFRRDYRFLEDEGVLQVRSDRRTHRPFGLYGGSPGRPSENYLNPDAREPRAARQVHHDDPEGRRVPPRARRRRRLGRSARARSGCGAARTCATSCCRSRRPRPTTASSSMRGRWMVNGPATERRRAEIRTRRGWREVPKVQWTDPVLAEQSDAASRWPRPS